MTKDQIKHNGTEAQNRTNIRIYVLSILVCGVRLAGVLTSYVGSEVALLPQSFNAIRTLKLGGFATLVAKVAYHVLSPAIYPEAFWTSSWLLVRADTTTVAL